MLSTYLDFERPLQDLDRKLETFGSSPAEGEERAELQSRRQALERDIYAKLGAWERVLLSRHPDRPQMLDFANWMFDEFIELHGDRSFSDDPSIVGGIARFRGRPVVFVGHQRGRSTAEKIRRNFGMPRPEGYRKALRLFELAERFGHPVITFVDTQGAYPGPDAEERGQAEAIARNLREMAGLRVPVVVCVIGEGGSGGALAISVGNRLLMFENACYSVITPEGCASILYRTKSPETVARAAESLRVTAKDLHELGVADEVVPEPAGGIHRYPQEGVHALAEALGRHLKELRMLDPEALVAQRYEKFRRMGSFERESRF